MKQNQVYGIRESGTDGWENQDERTNQSIKMTQNQVYGLGTKDKIGMTQNQGYGVLQSESVLTEHEQDLTHTYEAIDGPQPPIYDYIETDREN